MMIIMKTSKKASHTQRKLLDTKLKSLETTRTLSIPRSGWIKAIRGALGLTARQLATRLKTDMSTIIRMESRETRGAVTLETLERTARAMNCRLIYAIVPDPSYTSLESILDERALDLAKKMAHQVSHSMRLEDQGVGAMTTEDQIKQLAEQLKAKLDPRLWEK